MLKRKLVLLCSITTMSLSACGVREPQFVTDTSTLAQSSENISNESVLSKEDKQHQKNAEVMGDIAEKDTKEHIEGSKEMDTEENVIEVSSEEAKEPLTGHEKITITGDAIKGDIVESNRLNSDLGVAIDDSIVSIGDTINIDTYFERDALEGIFFNYERDKDAVIKQRITSYLRNSGTIHITDIDNIIVSVNVSAPFSFAGIQSGMTFRELREHLGLVDYDKSEDTEALTERYDIEVINSRNNELTVMIDNYLKAKFILSGNILNGLQISRKD